MKNSEAIIEVLNDLIEINNDRIVGYEKAAADIDPDEGSLKTLFHQLSDESRELKDVLSKKVEVLGGDPVVDKTTGIGKIYRAWMQAKVTFSGNDAHSILSSCEFGEDAAQRAYSDAVDASDNFPPDVKQVIENQKELLKMSHNLIRNQRDQFKVTVSH